MGAIEVIRQNIQPIEFDALLELADEQAATDGFAHVVAGWAEKAQDMCRKLDDRMKALEAWSDELDKSRIAGQKMPQPAPTDEALVEKIKLILSDGRDRNYTFEYLARKIIAAVRAS